MKLVVVAMKSQEAKRELGELKELLSIMKYTKGE